MWKRERKRMLQTNTNNSETKTKYIVQELDETAFPDFKEMPKNLRNLDLDMDRQKVQWLNIKSIKLLKKTIPMLLVRLLYDYAGQYHHLNLVQRIRKVTRTHTHTLSLSHTHTHTLIIFSISNACMYGCVH